MKFLAILCLTLAPLSAADLIQTMYNNELDLVENEILGLAQAMPADKYNFRPSPTAGAFSDVRTFGEQVKHVSTMMYMTAALVIGEPSPYGPGTRDNGPDTVQGKEQIVAYFKSAIAYARKAVASLNEKNHLETVTTYFGPMSRLAVASGLTYHSFNHYGQMVVYARMNGVIPPGSVPPQK